MLHLIGSIIVGFVVGFIARAIMPGAQHMGFMLTTTGACRARRPESGVRLPE